MSKVCGFDGFGILSTLNNKGFVDMDECVLTMLSLRSQEVENNIDSGVFDGIIEDGLVYNLRTDDDSDLRVCGKLLECWVHGSHN